MSETFDAIRVKLLDFELNGITEQQKVILAKAIDEILNDATRKRDALAVVKVQGLQARLNALIPNEAGAQHANLQQKILGDKEAFSERRPLRVFLCHSSDDKPIVRELFRRLSAEGWIDVWLDEEKILPGQDWGYEIEKALDSSDAVIVTLSTGSVSKEGYVQKEFRLVLDMALEKPEGTIFILPVRLDYCERPRKLRSIQGIDYFPTSNRDRAYARLLASLRERAKSLGYENVIEKTARLKDILKLAEQIRDAAILVFLEIEKILRSYLTDETQREAVYKKLVQLYGFHKHRYDKWKQLLLDFQLKETDPRIKNIARDLESDVDKLFEAFYEPSPHPGFTRDFKKQNFSLAMTLESERIQIESQLNAKVANWYLQYLRETVESIGNSVSRL